MPDSPLYLQAAARWLELGVTSATNPAHRKAFEIFFAPFGLGCEYLLSDPVGDQAAYGVIHPPLLCGVRWVPCQVHGDFASLFPDPATAHLITLIPQPSGLFEVHFNPAVPHELLESVDRFGAGKRLNALVEKSRLASARFIYRIFELSSMPDSVPGLSQALLDDPVAFVGMAAERVMHRAA
ncbi:MAG: hypothetical protein PHE83_17335 [Opitutaceae bacterium]|nr:hypothetical protein [Opitutaceae bacterium]